MAAREAAVKATQALQEARQKKAEEAARKKAEEAARKQAAFVPEVEEEEEEEKPENVHALVGSDQQQQAGLVLRKPKERQQQTQPKAAGKPSQEPGPASLLNQEQDALPGMRKPTRQEVLEKLAAARGGRSKEGEDGKEDVEAAARAKVMADLALLSGAKGAKEDAAEEEAVWQPPSGQTGDGKTSLNEALGY